MVGEIKLTDPTTVRGEDGADRLITREQMSVTLARLVLDRRTGTTRDELANTVWPDHLPPSWRSALRTLMSRLRELLAQALPSVTEPLVARCGRYVVRLPDTTIVDVERAEAAVWSAQDALASGDCARARHLALECVQRLTPPFLPTQTSEWATGVRAHLNELLLSALESASQASLSLGRCPEALALANDATTRAPFRESAHRGLMAAHMASGNRAEALRTYQRLRRRLVDELGVSPAAETESAYMELLAPNLLPSGDASPPPVAVADQRTPPFVGRHTELALLTKAWGRAAATSLQAVLITGEAGIGKTRLAVELASHAAAEGGLVLFGRCDRDPAAPYQPITDALDGYIAALNEDDTLLERAISHEVASHLFPSLRVGRPRPAQMDRAVVLESVIQVLTRAADDGPALMVLDDLQCADRDAMVLLRDLFHQIHRVRILFVSLFRTRPSQPGVPRFADPLLAPEGPSDRLHLSCLGPAETIALATSLLGRLPGEVDELAHALAVLSHGNPHRTIALAQCLPNFSHTSDIGR